MNQSAYPLPDFLLIGAMKAGSTSLAEALGEIPQIHIPPVKEPHFLCKENAIVEGRTLYRDLFRHRREGQLCGDASTGYAKLPDSHGVAERAKRVTPDARIIYIVRHPIERAISHHYHLMRVGKAPADMEVAAQKKAALVNYGRYMMQLQPWIESFGADRIHVVVFEEFIANPQAEMSRIRAFLGIPMQADCAECSIRRVANKGEEALVAGNWTRSLKRKVTRSNFYKTQIRARLPKFAAAVLKSLLLRRAVERPAPPSRATYEFFARAFAEDNAALQAFLGRPQPLWSIPFPEAGAATGVLVECLSDN
jgi:hypothetical protein